MTGAKDFLKRLREPWGKRFRALGRLAAERGRVVCLVGGCVRDLMLKREPLDWDVVVEGPAADLVQAMAGVFGAAKTVSHPSFLTSTLHFGDDTFLDIATARVETYPEPAALPLVEAGSLGDDFARRDFTVNAMALHLTPDRWGRLEDPFNGRSDLQKGLIRALHKKSFVDDPTRVFRAARYAGRLNARLEPLTRRWALKAVAEMGPGLLSPARLRHELERNLEEEDPRPAMKLLWQWGAWPFWSPRWRWSPFLVKAFSPLRDSAIRNPPSAILLRLTALCRFQDPSEARDDLLRLGFPNAVIDAVRQTLATLRFLEGRDTGRFPPALSEEARAFLCAALKDPKKVGRLKDSTPLLKGGDLAGLGYEPGPLFQEVFELLKRARWEGKIKTKTQEMRYVVAHFPLKK